MPKDQRNTRVLVVEDHPDFAQLICDILELKGCETTLAVSAEAAVDIAREMQPHMIFCDIRLPGKMSGRDFARVLRADEAFSNVPLIAISGYTSDEDRRAAIEAGFDMVFPKPVKFAHLTKALETYGHPILRNS